MVVRMMLKWHDVYTAVVGSIERRLIWYLFSFWSSCMRRRSYSCCHVQNYFVVWVFFLFFFLLFSFRGIRGKLFWFMFFHRFNRYTTIFFFSIFFSTNTLVPGHGAKSTYHYCKHEVTEYMAAYKRHLSYSILYLAQISIYHLVFHRVVQLIVSFFFAFLHSIKCQNVCWRSSEYREVNFFCRT